MRKKKQKCGNCEDPILNCGDCNAQTVGLNYQEAQDCLSALSFFRKDYEKSVREKCPDTLKAMAKVEKKLWKLKSSPEETKRRCPHCCCPCVDCAECNGQDEAMPQETAPCGWCGKPDCKYHRDRPVKNASKGTK